MKEILTEYRCECKKLLFKGFIFVGEIEIKCRFCKRTLTIDGLQGNLSNDHRYVLIATKQGKIIKATTSASKILGYSPDEIKKIYVHDLITCLNSSLYEKIWSNLEGNIAKSILFKGEETRKNGQMFPIQIGVRTYRSHMDKEELFIFDINCKPPQKLKKISLKPVKRT